MRVRVCSTRIVQNFVVIEKITVCALAIMYVVLCMYIVLCTIQVMVLLVHRRYPRGYRTSSQFVRWTVEPRTLSVSVWTQ